VLALFVGKLEEDLLAFRFLELLAVFFEELVRTSFALDADEQRLLVVAGHQPLGAFGEDPVGGALEEQERRARFELRVALQQLGIARFELLEVLFLFEREMLEGLAAARIAGHARRTRVELEAAPLRGNRDAQGVTGEDEIGVSVGAGRGAPGAALLAGAVDLDHALGRGETARGRHLFDEHLDIRAEELERAVTALANEMEMAGLPVRVLEPEPPLPEVDLAGDTRVHHPLQRAIDGGAADAMVVLADQVEQIVGAQVSFLAQEYIDDLLPFARALAAFRLQPAEIGKRGRHTDPWT